MVKDVPAQLLVVTVSPGKNEKASNQLLSGCRALLRKGVDMKIQPENSAQTVLVPPGRIELPTFRLLSGCCTTEL